MELRFAAVLKEDGEPLDARLIHILCLARAGGCDPALRRVFQKTYGKQRSALHSAA